MPTTEWLNKYESIKDKLACKTDLDAHFTEKVIGNMGVDVLDIGTVHFPPEPSLPAIRWWSWRIHRPLFRRFPPGLIREDLRGAQ